MTKAISRYWFWKQNRLQNEFPSIPSENSRKSVDSSIFKQKVRLFTLIFNSVEISDERRFVRDQRYLQVSFRMMKRNEKKKIIFQRPRIVNPIKRIYQTRAFNNFSAKFMNYGGTENRYLDCLTIGSRNKSTDRETDTHSDNFGCTRERLMRRYTLFCDLI